MWGPGPRGWIRGKAGLCAAEGSAGGLWTGRGRGDWRDSVACGRAHVGHLESLSSLLSCVLAVSPTSHLYILRARNPDPFPEDPCFLWLQDPGTVDTMYSSFNGESVVWEGVE